MSKAPVAYCAAAIREIKSAILQSRYQAARLANGEQLKLYFRIGGYVSANTRQGKWGCGAIEEIARQLQAELPGLRGFSAASIKKMRLFYEAWEPVLIHLVPRDEVGLDPNRSLAMNDLSSIDQDASRSSAMNDVPDSFSMKEFFSIGFTHHCEIIYNTKDSSERMYYIRRCAKEFWSVETLKRHLCADDFNHTGALPNNFAFVLPDEKHASRAVRAFKDEYLLDFVNIEDADSEDDVDERVLEQAIVGNVRKFIQSLGPQFSFIGNQYRLTVEGEEFFVDLLFFHRGLRCLVAIELKRGAFKPA